jgi:hypothetical protein
MIDMIRAQFCRVRRSGLRDRGESLVCEPLEQRLCLSGTQLSEFAPRLGNSPLFHTPIAPDDFHNVELVPRLGTPDDDQHHGDDNHDGHGHDGRDHDKDRFLDLGDGLVAFLTSEAEQGKDLNRDGDKRDNVLQSFDADRDRVQNSRQAAVIGSLIDLGDDLVGFLTDESEQGRRLNRDRDKQDLVFQIFDARDGTVRNSRQAVVDKLVDLGDGLVVFLTSEMEDGRVLNGDGDKQDFVLQSFDFESNRVRNSGQQASGRSLNDIGDGFVAFHTSESAQGRDLNGDGDKQDTVLQTFDALRGTVQNSGQAV